ncbi:MAG: hypothetical protein Q7R81_01145 [Candidatus Peregrinibacteria bacterium]|nr:hypothetical protein [Candidatus Peregrinibacteria bacterium]
MQRSCAQCKAGFEITEDDLSFYDNLSPVFGGKKYKIPPATRCADCRQQRRLAWRNERYMYKRKCDFTGQDIISMYPPDSPFKVYEQGVWWSDKWDAREYGRAFDFNRPFFDQFRELQLQVPRLSLVNKQSENAEFTNHSAKNKNCYLSAVTFECEDVYYSDWVIDHCKDIFDCSYLHEGSELCYETYYAWGSYRAFFCDFIKRCQDVWFCFDCTNCKNCFQCCNLRSKEYCIENKQYSREEYTRKMAEVLPFSAEELKKQREEYIRRKREVAIHPATYHVQTESSTGDLLFSTKNCTECFDTITAEDCRHCIDVIDVRDSMDTYHVGWSELMYECHAITNGYNCIVCHFTYDNRNIAYCDCTQNSQNLFGCAGLNKNEYCILNKQYTKGEYEDLVPQIIEHMQKSTEWGEFFPIAFSPFGYNQSRAMEYYPLTKAQASQQGIPWSDYDPPFPAAKTIIPAAEIPSSIADTTDDILHCALQCEISGKPFRIIKQELDFYRKTGVPLPQRHPDQRYADRMAQRPPRKLWHRQCAKCKQPIATSYSPDRLEIVYCDSCYLKEVY